MLNSILGWLFSTLGGDVLKLFLQWIERQWPASAPVINEILALLGQGVPPAQIVAHLQKLRG